MALLLLLRPARLAAEGQCTCACCQTAYRPPSLQVMNTEFMCSPVPENSEPTGEPPPQCGEQCVPDPEKTTIQADEGEGLLYARFCMMNCMPSSEELGAFCKDLPEEMREEGATEGGNGEDWASFVNSSAPAIPPAETNPDGNPVTSESEPEREESQAADELAKEEAEASKAAEDAVYQKAAELAAQVKARESGAMVAKAQGEDAKAKALEARAAAAEVKSAGTLANATEYLRTARREASMANDAKAQLSGSAVEAAVYARNAERAAAKAQAELQEILDAPMAAAKEAAKMAVVELRKKRDEWTTGYEKEAEPTRAPTLEVAELAAAPYYEAMSRAMEQRGKLEEEARRLNGIAGDLQSAARSAYRQAAIAQHAGNSQGARLMVDRSEELLLKSQMANDESQQEYARAEEINKGLAAYQEVASAAAARATALAPYRWMPPPPRIAGGPSPAPAMAPGPAPGAAPGAAPAPAASLLQRPVAATALRHHVRRL